jgi:hypothetical protein
MFRWHGLQGFLAADILSDSKGGVGSFFVTTFPLLFCSKIGQPNHTLHNDEDNGQFTNDWMRKCTVVLTADCHDLLWSDAVVLGWDGLQFGSNVVDGVGT